MLHRILRFFDLKALDADRSTMALIEPNGTILWFNESWRQFATTNDSASILIKYPVGSCYFDAISGELRGFFQGQLLRALDTGEPFHQEYECSTASQFRIYSMRALPIGIEALLLEHSELAHTDLSAKAVVPADESKFRYANGLIYQCSNCRRTKTLTGEWVRVPEWVTRCPPRTSHGVCKVCVGFYWGQRLRIKLPRNQSKLSS